jgi:hypothetical protein
MVLTNRIKRYRLVYMALSSMGRTPVFQSGKQGSNPCGATKNNTRSLVIVLPFQKLRP